MTEKVKYECSKCGKIAEACCCGVPVCCGQPMDSKSE